MKSLKYLRSDERQEFASPISPDALLGTWINTNEATRGIAKAMLTRKGGQIALHIVATGSPGHNDWGETGATIFAADTSSSEAMAFSASYDFGFMETQLQGHIRQGVLIIAKFDHFKDNSGRSSYFSKEFFYRTEA